MRNYVVIPESHVGLLYENGAFVGELAPGRHRLGGGLFARLFDRTVRAVTLVDLRERSLTLKGQEILTADKVAIRVSLLVYFRVDDAASAAHHVSSYLERIYEDVQLAARRFLATRKLEAILADRNEISEAVRLDVRGPAAQYGVEILRADVKDLVFPGNLREIMNQVLETERRAEAKLIQARKDAEAQRIKAQADAEAELMRVEAERERALLVSALEQDRFAQKLARDVELARTLAEHPELRAIRELQALSELATRGAKFVVGLDGLRANAALTHDGDA
jgi:regulator of protease activity HflC (stomatin/prohibitin superfamily)